MNKVDKAALAKSRDLFRAFFSGVDSVRTSIAHSGALTRSEVERAKHTVQGTNVIVSGMNGRTMHASHKGSGSFDLTAEALAALETSTAEYFRAYELVDAFHPRSSTSADQKRL